MNSRNLGLLQCLSRQVTPLSQLLEQADQDDQSDHWPCWGLGPSSPRLTHWPLRHHWTKAGSGVMSGKVKRTAEPVEEPTLSSNQLFIFMITYCQRTEEACALTVTQLLLLSIPRYVFAVRPVKPQWTASALSCQQLELTELRQTQLKSGKTVSHLSWIFPYTRFWQIHASLAALCCIYRTPNVHCCKLQITRGLGISLKACYVFCEALWCLLVWM